MLGNLVWLFREHREVYQEVERLRRVVDDLERQLALASLPSAEVAGDFLKQYVDSILVEEPYPDNKIPDVAWLTPGYGERIKEDVAA